MFNFVSLLTNIRQMTGKELCKTAQQIRLRFVLIESRICLSLEWRSDYLQMIQSSSTKD